MGWRKVLTERQRADLFSLPSDHDTLLRHYILSDDDLRRIGTRRQDANRLGYALQLCVFRYPGRLIAPGEVIPEPMLEFVAGQLSLAGDDLLNYGKRDRTRYEHSTALQEAYGYRPFEGAVRAELECWLCGAAEDAHSNGSLAAAFVAEMRSRMVIVPAISTLERLCSKALVRAEKSICERIASRLTGEQAAKLIGLLRTLAPDSETDTLFVWLRRTEAGGNSRSATELLDRLEKLEDLGVDPSVIDGIPAHRVAKLRRQGERYYADGMRRVPEERRLATLAVCAVEWRSSVIDALIETHDRIVGRLYKAAERTCAATLQAKQGSISDVLGSLANVAGQLVLAKQEGEDLDGAVDGSVGWDKLEALVAAATGLVTDVTADPLDHVVSGYARLRRYTPRLLSSLQFVAGPGGEPLLRALNVLRELNRQKNSELPDDPLIAFARPKWRKRLVPHTEPTRKEWETAVLFALRDALRSGDLRVEGSRRYGEPTKDLVPSADLRRRAAQLAVPFRPEDWLDARRDALQQALDHAARLAEDSKLPVEIIGNGKRINDAGSEDNDSDAEQLSRSLYRSLPEARITDLLIEVDEDTGFTEAFVDLRRGTPCEDKIGLLSVILADGINLGLKKMAASGSTHGHMELLRIARWHIEGAAYDRALAMLVEAQAALPMARLWGEGLTSSSDGQFFRSASTGEAVGLVNAKYGREPGVKAYAHVTDQYAPYSVKTIPSTASEAPFILDGLLSNEAGRRINEHYADTGGFTDQVFAMCALLGYAFAPRIRDLPDKRLYAFEPKAAPGAVRDLIARPVRTDLIVRNWPDILRLTASMATGAAVPSEVLRRLASYPRQNELAEALREVGRVERSLFMLQWITDPDLQRRAQSGLNKGEAHHALKRAIAFHRRGEMRDRSTEGQHDRMAGLNLLAMIVIYWNTKQLSRLVGDMATRGVAPDPRHLQHVSPLGWEHIQLAGEYRWPTNPAS